MTFEELEYLLKENEKINISKLAKELNVSRQTIHNWKQKNKIPKKYENSIFDTINKNTKIKITTVDIEINYQKEFFLLGNNIQINNNSLEISGINKNNEHITKKFNSKEYNIYESPKDNNNHFYTIERYETEINYKKEIIKYHIYCTHPGSGRIIPNYYITNKKLFRYFNLFNQKLYNKIYDNYDFKDIINYVKFLEKDIVFDLSKEKFYEIYKQFNYIDAEKKDILQPMGFYLKADQLIFEELCNYLEGKINKQKKNNFTYLNCIFISSEIIKENINILIEDIDILDKISKMTKGIYSSNNLDYEDLYKLVLSHELGHLIFSYNKSNNPTFEERRANYMVSNLFNNKYDLFNKYLTTYQPYTYKDILIKPETKKMYENIDNTITSSLNIIEYEKYYCEVEKLYG